VGKLNCRSTPSSETVIEILSSRMKDSFKADLGKAVAHSCALLDNAYNNNDPGALIRIFTENATLVTDTGILNGREAISKYQTEIFKIVKFSKHQSTADLESTHLIEADRKELFAAGSWSQTIQMPDKKPIRMRGFWSAIVVNDGTGRQLMQTWNTAPVYQAR
jgi:ketosteroid isomerase-like protein